MKNLILGIFLLFSGLMMAQSEIKPPAVEAKYTGGPEAMNKYLAKQLKYPANKKKSEGKVYIEFEIDEEGTVQKAKVLKGFDAELDKIALNAISSMPKWEAAKDDNGKKIRSRMVLPVKFQP